MVLISLNFTCISVYSLLVSFFKCSLLPYLFLSSCLMPLAHPLSLAELTGRGLWSNCSSICCNFYKLFSMPFDLSGIFLTVLGCWLICLLNSSKVPFVLLFMFLIFGCLCSWRASFANSESELWRAFFLPRGLNSLILDTASPFRTLWWTRSSTSGLFIFFKFFANAFFFAEIFAFSSFLCFFSSFSMSSYLNLSSRKLQLPDSIFFVSTETTSSFWNFLELSFSMWSFFSKRGF